MNKLNKALWGMVKVAIYCSIVMGIIGSLVLLVVIPQWVKAPEVLVPNLVGKSFYNAVSTLKNASLKASDVIEQKSSVEPQGNVIEQDPPANSSIKIHHKVKLTVSIGADLIAVPSVIGKAWDAAQETLGAAGFRTDTIARVHSTNYLPDTVIAQNPTEGSQKKRHTPVNLLVSLGRKPQYIQLDDFQDQPVSEVYPLLKAYGLNVKIVHSPHPKIRQGRIISHPKLVQSGDFITLKVSGKREDTENSGRWLKHKHNVSDKGEKALKIKIVIVDDYGEREVVKGSYAPGTSIDLEKRGVKVFGPVLVIVFENDTKLYKRHYQ